MPKYTIYIRAEDTAKWLAIKDRPNWLHACLNGVEPQHNIDKAIEVIRNQRVRYSQKPRPVPYFDPETIDQEGDKGYGWVQTKGEVGRNL